MKIVHLVAPARFGGLERVVRALAVGQNKSGDEVTVIALLESGVGEPPLVSELRDAGMRVIPVVHPARSFRAQRTSVLEICRSVRPDVLHSHGYLPDVLSASFRSTFPSTRVSTVHGFTGGGLRNRFYEWMQRRSYARFDAVVAVSKKLATELDSSRWSKRLHTLPNAWAPASSPLPRDTARKKLNLQGDIFTVGWVGRISREKGPDILLDAVPQLETLRLHVVFIGEGRGRAALQARARELGIEDRVSWCGELPDASRFFSAFDVFVNSSRTEGTPITLFEAMNAGVPVVATSVGGVPDIMSSDEALLIPPQNSAALSSAIREVNDHPHEAFARAARARRRLEKDFAASPWIEAYKRIYRIAAAAGGRA